MILGVLFYAVLSIMALGLLFLPSGFLGPSKKKALVFLKVIAVVILLSVLISVATHHVPVLR
jgi:hypothetical protein